jgi:shikimate dehydrogenase
MKAAVLGKPIAHSLSPVLHVAAYAALGLDDWSYTAIECGEADLPGLVDSCGPEWAGLSLTMPLKRAVLPLLDQVDPIAAATGGANTVIFRDGQRYGYNTDVPGMVTALSEAGVLSGSGAGGGGAGGGGVAPGPVTILGAGATACSTVAALRELGITSADVVVRDPSRTGALLAAARRLAFTVRLTETFPAGPGTFPAGPGTFPAGPGLLIATLPSGAADIYTERVRAAALTPTAVFDVVYAPWPTPLAMAAAESGATVISGFELLLHQAAVQVELMTGRSAPVAAMRAAGEKALAPITPPAP